MPKELLPGDLQSLPYPFLMCLDCLGKKLQN